MYSDRQPTQLYSPKLCLSSYMAVFSRVMSCCCCHSSTAGKVSSCRERLGLPHHSLSLMCSYTQCGHGPLFTTACNYVRTTHHHHCHLLHIAPFHLPVLYLQLLGVFTPELAAPQRVGGEGRSPSPLSFVCQPSGEGQLHCLAQVLTSNSTSQTEWRGCVQGRQVLLPLVGMLETLAM